MKTSRAYTDMLSYQNDAFKFSKTAKTHRQHVHHPHHSSRACGTCIFLQSSLSLTRNMNEKVDVELHYIFSKISKF